MATKINIPTNNIFNILIGIGTFSILVFYFSISNDDRLIQIIVTLILAEPHFFLTIPLLVLYKNLFIDDKLYFIYLPLFALVVLVYLFFQHTNLFYLIFLVSNLFHVNRQSQGVVKLSLKDKPKELTNLLWYYFTFFSVLFILPHLIQSLKSSIEFKILISIFAFLSFLFVINFLKFKFRSKESYLTLSGLLIFWPALFFDNLIFAMGAGISIHYLQYIFLTGKIISKQYEKRRIPIILISIFCYCIFSTYALSGSFSMNKTSIFILIPTLLQMFHFYYDSFIWRMSNPLIREKIVSSFN